MKRIFSTLFILSTLFLFTGCSGDNQGSANESTINFSLDIPEHILEENTPSTVAEKALNSIDTIEASVTLTRDEEEEITIDLVILDGKATGTIEAIDLGMWQVSAIISLGETILYQGASNLEFSGNGEVACNFTSEELEIVDVLAIENLIEEQIDGETITEVVEAYNQFAIDYYLYESKYFPHCCDEEGEMNMAVSPYTLSQLIGMIAVGAKTTTADELTDAFNLSSSSKSLIALNNAISPSERTEDNLDIKNMAWIHTNYQLLINYKNNLNLHYRANQAELDFSSLGNAYRDTVKDWIMESTEGYIVGSLPYSDSPEETRLVLTSTAYLARNWSSSLDESEYFDGLYENLQGKQFRVPMIKKTGIFNSFEDETVKAFELPLEGEELSIVIFMPKKWKFNKFEDGPVDLSEKLPQIITALKPTEIEVILPTFSIKMTATLKDYLEYRGIQTAFDEANADFSAINGLGFSYLSGVRQSVYIEVNASSLHLAGTATSVNEATEDEPMEFWGSFTLDSYMIHRYVYENEAEARPFIFAIRNRSNGAILSMGKVLNLQGEEVEEVRW